MDLSKLPKRINTREYQFGEINDKLIVVKEIAPEDIQDGAIIVPDEYTSKSRIRVGVVVDVGRNVTYNGLQSGDYILYDGGNRWVFYYNKMEFGIINEVSLLCKLEPIAKSKPVTKAKKAKISV